MLSLFPGLLYLAPVATALLRVAAGLVLLYLAYEFARERGKIANTHIALVGRVPEGFTLLGSVVMLVSGVFLVVGLYTQAFAIVGLLAGLKHTIFAKHYPHLMPISAGAGALLFVICLSLLFSGAGAFAFDLPL